MVKNGVKPQIKTCDLTSFLFVIPRENKRWAKLLVRFMYFRSETRAARRSLKKFSMSSEQYRSPVMKWLLSRDKCRIQQTFSWLSHLCDLSASERSSDLTVPGMWPLCYSWIGYRQANGPPWALRSNSVDHRSANIVKTQIARTLQWSQPLTDTDRYSIVIVLAASCRLLLIAA